MAYYDKPGKERSPKHFEKDFKNLKGSKVGRTGFMSRQKRIDNILMAGRNLEMWRKGGAYDIPEGSKEEDVELDPSRSVGFDIVDAQNIQAEMSDKLKAHNESVADIVKKNNEAKKVVEREKLKEELKIELEMGNGIR